MDEEYADDVAEEEGGGDGDEGGDRDDEGLLRTDGLAGKVI